MSRVDLTGKIFGRLTCVEFVGPDKYGDSLWKCSCSCGKFTITRISDLTCGKSKSCGCYARDKARITFTTHGLSRGSDGKANRMYRIWLSLRDRCNNKKCKRFGDYGGRGIKVCKEWDDYKNFYDWSIANGYQEGLTIDRINNDGNYEPENCRWATIAIQARNTRRNVNITYQGQTKPLIDWAEQLGVRYHLLYDRLYFGWDIEKAFTEPARRIKK